MLQRSRLGVDPVDGGAAVNARKPHEPLMRLIKQLVDSPVRLARAVLVPWKCVDRDGGNGNDPRVSVRRRWFGSGRTVACGVILRVWKFFLCRYINRPRMSFSGAFVLASYLSIAAAVGICSDTDRSCWSWAQAGECDQLHVRSLCPVSCGVVPHTCVDNSEHCVAWAREGQCLSNTPFMHSNCPISCGIGRLKCYDIDHADCAYWTERGELEFNAAWMAVHCPVSMGICKRRCVDNLSDCAAWAADGECSSNFKFALGACPMSCDMCALGEHIVDIEHTPMCRIWSSRGECTSNAAMMSKLCADTCGIGEVVCADTHPDCVNWANEGRCTSDEPFMQSSCAASCGICSSIADLYTEYLVNKEDL